MIILRDGKINRKYFCLNSFKNYMGRQKSIKLMKVLRLLALKILNKEALLVEFSVVLRQEQYYSMLIILVQERNISIGKL